VVGLGIGAEDAPSAGDDRTREMALGAGEAGVETDRLWSASAPGYVNGRIAFPSRQRCHLTTFGITHGPTGMDLRASCSTGSGWNE
jgi:hypothetical protein